MINFPKGIEAYASKHSDRESSLLYDLAQETSQLIPNSDSTGSLHTIGTLLRLLVQVSDAKNILEIGTYTGYSAICMSEGMSKDGKLVTIDINEELKPIIDNFLMKSPKKP